MGGGGRKRPGLADCHPFLASTCEELCIEHVHSLVVPRVLTLEIDGVQDVFDEDGEHHGHENGVLRKEKKGKEKEVSNHLLAFTSPVTRNTLGKWSRTEHIPVPSL